MATLLAQWRTRVGFGLMLFTYGEFVGWQHLTTNLPQDWLATGVVYVALVGITLDLLVRWHMIESINILLAAGVFGVLHGALVSTNLPRNLPLSIIVFGTATPTLMFLFAYGNFRLLYAGNVPFQWLYISAPIVGLLYGVWTQWLPETSTVNLETPALSSVLPYTIIMLALSGLVLFAIKMPPHLTRLDWLLTPYETVACWGVLLVVVISRANNGQLSTFAFVISAIILGALIGLARFYRTLSPMPPQWTMTRASDTRILPQWMVMLVPFGIMAIVGYNLPQNGTQSLQGSFLLGGLLLFGILWPPIVSFLVSMQAFIELGRQEF